MSKIRRVEVHEFEFEARNLARDGVAQSFTFQRGGTVRIAKFAVVIHTADGGRGEYVRRKGKAREKVATGLRPSTGRLLLARRRNP